MGKKKLQELANEFGKPFKEAFMEPTKLYVKPMLAALAKHPIKAMAHITGGGLIENLPRVLPDSLAAELTRSNWPRTELFTWLQSTACIDDIEMNRAFNDGIGMAIVIGQDCDESLIKTLQDQGQEVYEIGKIIPYSSGERIHLK